MSLFYAPELLATLSLPEQEAIHALRVLRLTDGDMIEVTDGAGCYYKARIAGATSKRCPLEIEQQQQVAPHWSHRIYIAVAPTKIMDRMEWFVEKAVEIGVDRISFLRCRYSERKDLKLERVEKIAISAMKQSLKMQLPQLDELTDFKSFLEQELPSQRFICHCYPAEKPLLKQAYDPQQDAVVLLGPEGDFSPQEVALAQEHGFVAVSLGDTRLRTETAALVACHTLQLMQG